MTARESEIIGLIHKEVKPALGCTEPIAVALAVALISSGIAYYAMWALAAVVFALAVYYTVKQL